MFFSLCNKPIARLITSSVASNFLLRGKLFGWGGSLSEAATIPELFRHYLAHHHTLQSVTSALKYRLWLGSLAGREGGGEGTAGK